MADHMLSLNRWVPSQFRCLRPKLPSVLTSDKTKESKRGIQGEKDTTFSITMNLKHTIKQILNI